MPVLDYEPFVLSPRTGAPAPLTPIQEEILALKRARNAVILAHNYQIRIHPAGGRLRRRLARLSYQAAAAKAE